MPFEKIALFKIGAPPLALFEITYALGRLGVAVFEERPQVFAPAPPLPIEEDLRQLGGWLELLGGGRGGVEVPRDRLLHELLRDALGAVERCTQAYRRGDQVVETVSKREVMECLKSAGWDIDAVATLYRHAAWTAEMYNRCAYSEGRETGQYFTSLERELAAQEAERRRLEMIYKFLSELPPGGLKVPRGYQVVLNPIHRVEAPHERVRIGDLDVYITVEGQDYGGVAVPREYLLDPQLARRLVADALASADRALAKLRERLAYLRSQYEKFSAFGDYNWGRDAATVAFYVRERDLKAVDEAIAKVLARFYTATSFAYRLEVSTKFIYTAEAPRAERWPKPIQAFTTLVYMVGPPGPEEISPVPLVALLFPVFFGWMFGDVGHGLLIAAVALLLHKLGKRDWAYIWGAAAASSIAFGLYYGEVFGLPLWGAERAEHPIAEGLAAAAVFGFLVVLVAFLLKILNLLLLGERFMALGPYAGLLALYVSIGAAFLKLFNVADALSGRPGAWLLAGLIDAAPHIALFSAVWLAASMTYAIRRYRAKPSEVLGELPLAFIETFIGATANLFSFMRLEIIHVIHATLTHLTLRAASLPGGIAITILLQLLVVLGEGFLTTIQSLRLVYYETLTKFYHGTGRIFKPDKIEEK
ncbi:V-type ATPase 116kDa subunit family protein [Pyrobaculum neutrophilum]|uniref:A-type ATP synthase subunit I n=1 Tax=Pyrobaculum neutrophilum (strain DSM 2338 / JCM 9278 / NBRC 100436 / V24Sta) TaxID=444157 RepID=B1YD29_PYRNV|nr:V-type ATPase 116kDa subunit family protein [Pyrobaculum neutrophilum]ACB39692.1 H+-ATPase subunit I-like protein [Pyrobaculum neutrophilum V24Sta]